MCFSIQRPLPHKPENNFWLDFLPAFLLRAGGGGGEEWESTLHRDQDSEMGARSLEEVSRVPGGGGNPTPPLESLWHIT